METQKQQFILLWQTGKFTISALCREFGISRPTGYKILKRYEVDGMDALAERPRSPHFHPNETSQSVIDLILKIRKQYPYWGARKVLTILERDYGLSDRPCESTVNAIMKRHGLVKIRRRRPSKIRNQYPIFDPEYPNEIWSADYKGKFRMKNGIYCNPLTIADSKSRFIYEIKALERTTIETSKPVFCIFRRT